MMQNNILQLVLQPQLTVCYSVYARQIEPLKDIYMKSTQYATDEA